MVLLACKSGDRASQKRLYQQFYGFGMSIALRYAARREEAEEICHDGFLKVFAKIGDCRSVGAFKAWMRQIFVRAAIDYYRKFHQKQPFLETLDRATEVETENPALDNLSTEEKLGMVRQLPAVARLTFNLYALEGFSTAEIAAELGVAEGTVRTNLANARARLQKIILESDKIHHTNIYG